MNQTELYKRIDKFFTSNKSGASVSFAQEIVNINKDARDYFYNTAPIDWIDWLQEQDFFADLNKSASDKNQYRYQMPELEYLLRVVREGGRYTQVVKVIQGVDCARNFNPEVISRFIHIIDYLPPEHLPKIIQKMLDEKWVELMRNFRESGYQYKKMIQSLVEAKDWDTLLILAETLFDGEDKPKKGDLFYLHDVHDSGIFKALKGVGNTHQERALSSLVSVLKRGLDLERNQDDVFEFYDQYTLLDEDFFKTKLDDGKKRFSDREEIHAVVATIIELVRVTMDRCDNDAQKIYEQYIVCLPDTQAMWRLKLFVLAQCPNLLIDLLRQSLDRIFDKNDDGRSFHSLTMGAEYETALMNSFPQLGSDWQCSYVEKLFDLVDRLCAAEETKDGKDKMKNLVAVLFYRIRDSLSEEQKEKFAQYFGYGIENFKYGVDPVPAIGVTTGGSVKPQSVAKEEDFNDPIVAVEKLKTDYSRMALKNQYDVDQDFLHPRNVEGVANHLKSKIKEDIDKFATSATLFFDKEDIDVEYTHAFIRAIEEYLRDGGTVSDSGWEQILLLFENIQKERDELTPEPVKEGLGMRWEWVRSIIAEVLQKGLLDKQWSKSFYTQNRGRVLKIIDTLWESASPDPKTETEKGSGDLFTIAINSTRGRVFEVLVHVAYRDGDVLDDDVKKFFEKALGDESLAIRAMIGHYLPQFYFRDKKWGHKKLRQLFSQEDERKYIAAIEGYVSQNLYQELFEESIVQSVYRFAIENDFQQISEDTHWVNVKEKVADHIALAFVHYDNFTIKSNLFELLFEKSSVEQQSEFISFVGRHVFSRKGMDDVILQKEHIDLQKMKNLWDYLLGQDLDSKVYESFSFWVDEENALLDGAFVVSRLKKTLEKTQGKVEYEYHMIKVLVSYSKEFPQDVLTIMESYLLSLVNSDENNWIHIDEDYQEIFRNLYDDKGTQKDTKSFVNELLVHEKGGRIFRPLANIVKD